jgi:dTDP-4-dehydrorhamnose reductase
MRVVVLGDGLLGSEIIKQTGWDFISRKKDNFDINNHESFFQFFIENYNSIVFWKKYDIIINCIANTDTYSSNKEDMYNTNYKSVAALSDFCKKENIKLVHISTDYIYAGSVSNATEEDLPIPANNWYSYYKLLADEYISLTNSNHLICRCLFKEKPFQFEYAWTDQIGNFDYVDVIANLIIHLVNSEAIGIFNVGTKLKTIFQLAEQTKGVKESLRPEWVPNDVSTNTSKLYNFLNERLSNIKSDG